MGTVSALNKTYFEIKFDHHDKEICNDQLLSSGPYSVVEQNSALNEGDTVYASAHSKVAWVKSLVFCNVRVLMEFHPSYTHKN